MYIPDGLENRWFFRLIAFSFYFYSKLAVWGSRLKIGQEASILRSIIDFSSKTFASKNKNVQIDNTTLNGVKVRIYRPRAKKTGTKLHPGMIFIHGGGYSIGNLDTYDEYLFQFVIQLNMIVFSVDYRMAPEHPFPTPTNDCYAVAKYVIENGEKLDVDVKRLVIAGDSAGGNATAVVTSRLRRENIQLPKVQVLIYPWLQIVSNGLPSVKHYAKTGIFGGSEVGFVKFISWYFGITNITRDVEEIFDQNEVLGLIDDPERQRKILSYLDVDQIPDEYKPHRSYYERAKSAKRESLVRLSETSPLRRDAKLAELGRKLFEPDASPLLLDQDEMVGLPKTYFIVLEWDSLKDEGLLYAQRLKKAGVEVEIAFYENAFHGIASFVGSFCSFRLALEMQKRLIEYLQKNL